MRLVLDSGNSSIKYGLFENHNLISSGTIQRNDSIYSAISTDILNKVTIIASCKVTDSLNIKDLPAVKHIAINKDSVFPFKINYKNSESLGIDRVVACVSGFEKQKSLLVIDSGTCVTYDYISDKGVYEGGAISPGVQLRFKAMHNFTEQLPLITEFEKKPVIVGNDTFSCMKSGVINGLAFEMDGFINNYLKIDNQLKVFLTGGDAIFFADALKNSIFAQQNLVLKGLDLLIDLNEK